MTNEDEAPGGTRRRHLALEIGARVKAERRRLGFTLDELAARGGSSRSMLSAIERGDKIPTVLTLDQIASALGVSVSRLLASQTQSRVSVIRRQDQKIVQEPERRGRKPGFWRRVTSPVLENVNFEMGRLEMEAGVDGGTYPPHQPGWSEYVVVESGILEMTIDGLSHRLDTGDAIYFASDCTHAYRNIGDKPCIAYVVMTGPQTLPQRTRDDMAYPLGRAQADSFSIDDQE
ncbi:helix-turn-helix domain-containing protein [Arthrobacter sp. CDRTa11]|uniref:helix-turn-helix domain-containing protein n=1 Tax=Arthrobacter sp. CDRTa11 TaxID=2651199 RepID=UPI00226598BD|nr:XRE family transcriptional regulator [Arthrobacter sp. CDRTa11]UZX02927.1 helix-turn-helix domain-containing protein [Arthrobacter sp. CDRTa11]